MSETSTESIINNFEFGAKNVQPQNEDLRVRNSNENFDTLNSEFKKNNECIFAGDLLNNNFDNESFNIVTSGKQLKSNCTNFSEVGDKTIDVSDTQTSFDETDSENCVDGVNEVLGEVTSEKVSEKLSEQDVGRNRDSSRQCSAVVTIDSSEIESFETASEASSYYSVELPKIEKDTIIVKEKITKISIYKNLLSMLLYISDVGSDWLVGIRYAFEGNWLHFMLTILFVIGCSVLTTYFGKATIGPGKMKVSTRLAFIFNLTPVLIYGQIISSINRYLNYTILKYKHDEYENYIEKVSSVSVLRLFESLLEATPQFVLQLTLLLRLRPLTLSVTMCFQLFSILTSSVGSILTYLGWYRSSDLRNKRYISLCGGILFAVGMGVPLVCRCMCMASAFSISPFFTLLGIVFHSVGMGIWITYKKPESQTTKTNAFLIGIFWPFAPYFNDECTLLERFGVNTVMFWEDIAMLLVWSISVRKVFPGVLIILAFDFVCRFISCIHWIYREEFISNLYEDTVITKKLKRLEDDL